MLPMVEVFDIVEEAETQTWLDKKGPVEPVGVRSTSTVN